MSYAVIGGCAVASWFCWEFRVHALLPARAQIARARGRLDECRDLYLNSLRSPSVLGESWRVNARFRLASVLSELGSHDAAIEQCGIILRRRLVPGIEANTRRRLADCLEAAGRSAEAAAERDKVTALLPEMGSDAESVLARAREMVAQHRYPEACSLYEESLAVIPSGNHPLRAETLVKLALASFNAGRPEAAARRAEEAIVLKPGLQHLLSAHSVAGLGHKSLGNLDVSEKHRTKALAIAMALGNQDKAADCLAALAGVQLARGRIVEAAQSARKAAEMSIANRRIALVVQAEALREWGRFDEACDTLQEARKAKGLSVPRFEQRSQLGLTLGLASFEAEAGHWESAARYLEEARADINDPRFALWALAQQAWISAEQGAEDSARHDMATASEMAKGLKGDVSMQKLVHERLARAALALHDPSTGLAEALSWLELGPEPVGLPSAHLLIGESRLLMGDIPAARQSFEAALAVGVDSHSAREAQRHLDDMNGAA